MDAHICMPNVGVYVIITNNYIYNFLFFYYYGLRNW